jgi:signal transduction histidine kinase
VFRSSSLRLAAVYTLAFALSVVILGVFTLITTRAALSTQFNNRILSDSAEMLREYRSEGITGVIDAVHEHDRTPGALDYGLQSPTGAPMAGNLANIQEPYGWSTVSVSTRRDRQEGRSRVYVAPLPGGYRIIVGDDLARIEAVDSVLLRSFALAFVGILLLGGMGGYALSRNVRRRIASIDATAQAIINGDLGSRVPVHGGEDELDRLAATLNRMLDRIAGLMESLRQVSMDVAHDLRTPLTHLRQRLEATLHRSESGADRETLEVALTDLDSILATFAALLRISQIEGGARRAGFRPTDLTALAAHVVEAFRPSAEENGQTLDLEVHGSAIIDGDRELLTQMLANLVENALRHAGPGARVRVRSWMSGGARRISVVDNGPGVPASERVRLFDRFYRLEASRSTPGNGLGLALVAAVARLHDAEATLLDAGPGLEARISFPAAG